MTTALALPSLLPGQLHEQGMEIPPDLSFDAWEFALRNAEWIERAAPWWVVDLVAFGRARFGEDYSQALPDAIDDADGFHQAKLKQAEWMADCWPPGTRVPGQSYSAHRAVAKLGRREALALLSETDKEGRRLPVRTLIRRADEVEESQRGQAVTADGKPAGLPSARWMPQLTDLTDEARDALLADAPRGRHQLGWISGFLAALVWADQQDAFSHWGGPEREEAVR